MKAPLFWYRLAGLEAALLAPFGQIYRTAGRIRRIFATPYRAPIPVVCVGNVVAGGAGKTPTALALAHRLQRTGAKPVFVTRGYGGRERGPLRVDPLRHKAQDVGDEALILASAAECWIGGDRAATLRAAAESSQATHVIMDDGLQNPNVASTLNLLVIDGASGLGNSHIIPAGPLRESLEDALARVAAVVMIGQESPEVARRLMNVPVLRARLEPQLPKDFAREKPCLAFAGIGRPEKFFTSCREAGLTLALTRNFPDHHPFSEPELRKLCDEAARHGLRLITTAKDWVRLPDSYRASITVLPVALVFDDEDAVAEILAALR